MPPPSTFNVIIQGEDTLNNYPETIESSKRHFALRNEKLADISTQFRVTKKTTTVEEEEEETQETARRKNIVVSVGPLSRSPRSRSPSTRGPAANGRKDSGRCSGNGGGGGSRREKADSYQSVLREGPIVVASLLEPAPSIIHDGATAGGGGGRRCNGGRPIRNPCGRFRDARAGVP
ncbi:hypothetical protein GWI33_019796 [Rhynchophorus ferrugineus]|uniref:Uncharacterized protein n=1 Tax=Rhynchophorus ferrugineus TaxID=354439 RepID=A0A834HTQ4_RHYFE|nr:hypothetical protein GWI33_019796 [Rhynchophorus ferrugineus]